MGHVSMDRTITEFDVAGEYGIGLAFQSIKGEVACDNLTARGYGKNSVDGSARVSANS